MSNHLRVLACLLALFATGACATLSLPPVTSSGAIDAGDYADVGAVVLEDDATLSYERLVPPGRSNEQLVAVLDHRRRIKILRPAGLKEAEVELPVDAYTTVTDVVARSVAPDKLVRNMRHGATRIVARPDPASRAPDVVHLAFSIPDPAVAGEIEYRYRRVYLDPLAVPLWTFGAGRLPVLHSTFGLEVADGVQIDVRHGTGDHAIDRAPDRREVLPDGRSRSVYLISDQPAYFDESHAVHIAHRAPWLAPAVRQVRVGGHIEHFDSWEQVVHPLTKRIDAVDAPSKQGSVRERLRQARGELTPLRGTGLGLRSPQRAEDLRNGSLACSRDAAAYARDSLLGSAAKPAVVLLTGPDAPPFSEDFPTLLPFTQAVLEVEAGLNLPEARDCAGLPWSRDFGCDLPPRGRVLVDASCSGCALGVLPAGYEGTRALRILEDGSTSWITVMQGGPERHSLVSRSAFTLDVDGSLSGQLHSELRGSVAARWRQGVMHPAWAEGASPQRTLAQRMLLGDGAGPRLDGLNQKNLDNPETALTADAQLHAKLPRAPFGRFALAPQLLAGNSVPQSWTGQRRSATKLDGPRWREDEVVIELPVGWKAQLPPPVRWINDVAEYGAQFTQKGRRLTYHRRLVLKTAVADAEAWEGFHDLFESIRLAEAASLGFDIDD